MRAFVAGVSEKIRMYGVPANLDLSAFRGAMLVQIALGESQVQFKFERDLEIAAENGWQLIDCNSHIIDCEKPNAERSEYRLHLLLGRKVEEWVVHAPKWFELRFEGGLSLRVCDDSSDHESFSIQPGDIFV